MEQNNLKVIAVQNVVVCSAHILRSYRLMLNWVLLFSLGVEEDDELINCDFLQSVAYIFNLIYCIFFSFLI
jgi:hypothetical protein